MNLKWGNVQLPGVCKELFYWSAVPLPCSARAYLSLKHWQKRRAREKKRGKRERERKERCWSQRSGIINGDFWEFIELSIMSWHGDQDQIIVTQSFLQCHSQWKRPKKIKGKNRWWVVSKTVVYVLVLNCRTVYCKLSADLIIQIKQLGSTDV